jgi:dolichol-phosphate mannosyltransferase
LVSESGGTVWVALPTYNEAENITRMLESLLAVFAESGIDGHVLVIDDGSPDGTGDLADRMADDSPRIHVLHRASKGGIGPAYRAGFRYALDAGARFVIQMDCDFSHDPRAVATLVSAAQEADLVLGSRYVRGGGTRRWGLGRRIISRFGCIYAKTVLHVPIHDLTGGFKCFRRTVLETIPLDQVHAAGYGFQIEMTYRALLLGFRVHEVPIIFTDRELGESKMSGAIVVEAATLVPRLRHRLRHAHLEVPLHVS